MLLLIEKHPWNNMVQLKAHLIFEDLFKTAELTNEDKLEFLKASDVLNLLVRMSKTPEVKFATGNRIRNGYMGFCIKLSNLINDKVDSSDLKEMQESWDKEAPSSQEETVVSKWNSFVQNELATSNERNARNLGGRTQSTISDEEETNQFDVNMDNIMKRFKCFNTVISSSNNTDDDEEDEVINEPEGEGEGDADGDSATTDTESKSA